MIFDVTEMEALIRSRLGESSTTRITSEEILNAINNGYIDVSAKALCIETENNKTTTTGNRYIRLGGHRINFIEYQPEAVGSYMDSISFQLAASIASGEYFVPIPVFSATSGEYICPPATLTITNELPLAQRVIYYTTDGSDPRTSTTRILYPESAITIPGFVPGDARGTVKETKATAYAGGDYSPVATFAYTFGYYYPYHGDFLYDEREYWGGSYLGITGGEIASGEYVLMIVSPPAVPSEEKNFEFTGGEIDSGAYTLVVTSAPAVIAEEKNFEFTGGEIVEGKYWNPVVEIEPPWN
jgi:hypothetical protein